MLRTSLILAASLLAANVVAAPPVAPAAQVKNVPAMATTDSQKFALDRLMDMAKFLGSTQKFSATLRVGYDVPQANGQTIEFGEFRDIWISRPNLLRMEETGSDGGQSLTLFDGKLITVYDDDTGTYAQAPQPGSIDDSVIYFVRDLKMRLPLAPLLMQTFSDELGRRLQSIEYVERTAVVGQPAHHIAGRTANADFQIWIADSKQPLPLRMIMNYRKAEGQPKFWADFSNWNLSPKFRKSTFAFNPPSDANQIVFAVQLAPPPPPPPQATQPKGGRK